MNKFPNISRSFTELFQREFKSEKRKELFKAIIIASTILFLTAAIVLLIILFKFLQTKDSIEREKASLEAQVNFWRTVALERPDYRDAYFELSRLEYRLKDINLSRLYLEKALTLDPNFKQGKEFEKVLKRSY